MFFHLPGGIGLLSLCDSEIEKGVGEDKGYLYSPSQTLNPTLLVILITDVLIYFLFA